jgi:hypothetical protein
MQSRPTASHVVSEIYCHYSKFHESLQSFTIPFHSSHFQSVSFCADPVAARSQVWALSARTLDRGFESRLRHGWLSSSFYVVLSCVGRGLATS